MEPAGYIDYAEVLDVPRDASPGEVRKTYKRKMKALVGEIRQAQMTEDRRSKFLLDMARQNAAAYVLRDKAKAEAYWAERDALIALENEWREKHAADPASADGIRQRFDTRVKAFLSKYVEESVLEAGNDKEIVESSGWNQAHTRHAMRILRHYRHRLYHDILARLPFYEVTRPEVDAEERAAFVARLVRAEAAHGA